MLLVMTMAARYPWRLVLLASASATALVMAVAVLFGEVAAAVLPPWAVAFGAAGLFFVFGLWTLLGGEEEAEEEAVLAAGKNRPGLLLVAALAGTLILSELGDKTQIAVLSIAGLNPGERLLVWTGASAGMFSVQALAIGLGARATRYLPRELIEKVAGFVFIGFGVLAVIIGVSEVR